MSKKMWCAPVLAGLLLLGAVLPAQATPVTWNLKNVTFDDGGTASGWIAYDAEAPKSSTFNVTVTAGSALPAFTYDSTTNVLDLPGTGLNAFFLWPSSGPNNRRFFNMAFADPLTDAGGTHDLLTSDSFDCAGCSPWRYVTGGSLTTLADVPGPKGVPEPATLALMVPALGMLGWMARRRKQKGA